MNIDNALSLVWQTIARVSMNMNIVQWIMSQYIPTVLIASLVFTTPSISHTNTHTHFLCIALVCTHGDGGINEAMHLRPRRLSTQIYTHFIKL